jgi:Xaa-Pro aminopeptidase
MTEQLAMSEFDQKQRRLGALLHDHKLDAALLSQSANFAWATCGAESYINRADSLGIASLLITPGKRYVITTNIEAERLAQEQGLAEQGWEIKGLPWYEQNDAIAQLTQGMKLGSDAAFSNALDLNAEIVSLRSELTPEEGERYRELGKLCAQAMQTAIDAVRPGMTEYEIGANLLQATENKGVQGIVNLIATDERIFFYRHPLPTSKKLDKYAMLVLCGRKGGLICSITRLVHFGALTDEIRRKQKAVAQIDAEMIAATRPGFTIGDVFRKAQSAYASTGFANEWQFHHQGGSAGYAPREFTATPTSTQPILAGQSFAWNPSIKGVKSEDTFLVGEHANEIVTEMAGWPSLDVKVDGLVIQRPAILEK